MSKSSIDWYVQRVYDIEFAFTQGVFDNNEYQSRKSEALKEAKEMHKEEIFNAINIVGIKNAIKVNTLLGMIRTFSNLKMGIFKPNENDAQDYYNETYGGNNGRSS
jgi:hypothetical protein